MQEINEIPNNCGIYKITCLANDKMYIGGSINLSKRKQVHFRRLKKNKHSNSGL